MLRIVQKAFNKHFKDHTEFYISKRIVENLASRNAKRQHSDSAWEAIKAEGRNVQSSEVPISVEEGWASAVSLRIQIAEHYWILISDKQVEKLVRQMVDVCRCLKTLFTIVSLPQPGSRSCKCCKCCKWKRWKR